MSIFEVGSRFQISTADEKTFSVRNVREYLISSKVCKETRTLLVKEYIKDFKDFSFPYLPEDAKLPPYACSYAVSANSVEVTTKLDKIICQDDETGNLWEAYICLDDRYPFKGLGNILFKNEFEKLIGTILVKHVSET